MNYALNAMLLIQILNHLCNNFPSENILHTFKNNNKVYLALRGRNNSSKNSEKCSKNRGKIHTHFHIYCVYSVFFLKSLVFILSAIKTISILLLSLTLNVDFITSKENATATKEKNGNKNHPYTKKHFKNFQFTENKETFSFL